MKLLVLLFAVAAGAVVQGLIGFGFALVVVPVLTFVRPEVLPATVLLLTLPLSVTMHVILMVGQTGEIRHHSLATLDGTSRLF